MVIKNIVKRIIGIYDFDREAERLIKKSIKIYKKGGLINKIRARRLQNIIQRNFNCSFPPFIDVGENIYIAHPQGISIGRTAIIGDNCRIYPGAGIVAAIKGDNERYINKQRRHAKIGNNCILGYGCTLIGSITIGDNVVIGARAIVTKDIPSNSLVKNVNEIKPLKRDDFF